MREWGNGGVSKNRGTPNWMVYKWKTTIKMDDLGVPLFSEGCLGQLGGVSWSTRDLFCWAILIDTGLFFPWDFSDH